LIVIKFNDDHFFITNWDIEKNIQQEFFDHITKDYKVLWDTEGRPYIINEGKVTITEKKITTTAYSNLPLGLDS